jgi:hypothetical protein
MIDQLTSYLADVPVWALATICAASGGALLLIALVWLSMYRQRHYWRGFRQAQAMDDKPAPYASKLPSGTGGKVDAPWVAREELERDYSKSRNIDSWIEQFAARLDALEAKPEHGEWRGFQAGAYFVLAKDYRAEAWQRIAGQTTWQTLGTRGGPADALSGYHTWAELYGTELDALVAEFLEWKGRQG